MRFLRWSMVGPIIALIAIWYVPFNIAYIPVGADASADAIDKMRLLPDNQVLLELRDIGVSYPSFADIDADTVLRIAEILKSDVRLPDGEEAESPFPESVDRELFRHADWKIGLHGFAVPSLLGRAHELSGDSEYLQLAVDYIRDYARVHDALWLPNEAFYNEHSTAARAIVLTEIWRLYRNSATYEAEAAADLVRYATKLSLLLRNNHLFEYRSNHGTMQCLSLMHLAIAFPAIDSVSDGFQAGADRLAVQLNYYVNEEGVILEHSPGYQINGMMRLASLWRYFGLRGIAVPQEFLGRYHDALEFSKVLRRPDGTLPPIGDTQSVPYPAIDIAILNSQSIATGLEQSQDAWATTPPRWTLKPAAGYGVVWRGAESPTEGTPLSQSVMHWGNFVSNVHKHADELGLSIWAGGKQWVRPVGSWPYDATRPAAMGWRSSNAPHWLGEARKGPRQSRLLAALDSDAVSFLDVERRGADGGTLRRQLAVVGPETWLIIDTFESAAGATGETVWRFDAEVSLQRTSNGQLVARAADKQLSVLFSVPAGTAIDIDADGTSSWNGGIVGEDGIVEAPAVRVLLDEPTGVTATGLVLHDQQSVDEPVVDLQLDWVSSTDWRATFVGESASELDLRRRGDTLELVGPGRSRVSLSLDTGADLEAAAAALHAEQAYYRNVAEFGEPFHLRIKRRNKVTVAVLLAAVLQVAILLLLVRRSPRAVVPVSLLSLAGWIGLTAFLQFSFLV